MRGGLQNTTGPAWRGARAVSCTPIILGSRIPVILPRGPRLPPGKTASGRRSALRRALLMLVESIRAPSTCFKMFSRICFLKYSYQVGRSKNDELAPR